jgi:hypothetical protein
MEKTINKHIQISSSNNNSNNKSIVTSPTLPPSLLSLFFHHNFHPFPLLLKYNVFIKEDYINVILDALLILAQFKIQISNIVGDNLPLKVDAFTLDSTIDNLRQRLIESINKQIQIKSSILINSIILHKNHLN